jgi:cupin 2 domain-containing protein
MQLRNLFAQWPESCSEVFEDLVATRDFRLERIVSSGQATPPGEWLSQDQTEWVVLLTGSAALRFEGEPAETLLRPGDYVTIPAGRCHRVEWTDASCSTVWLALHYSTCEDPE